MTVVDVLLVLAFAMQAGGVVVVAVAAWLHGRNWERLAPLVWGGVFTTCSGTAILLVALFLAAVSAVHS